jgi:hypothetical protein
MLEGAACDGGFSRIEELLAEFAIPASAATCT